MRFRVGSLRMSLAFFMLAWGYMFGDTDSIRAEELASPNGRIQITLGMKNGQPQYSCRYDNIEILAPSLLGWQTDHELTDSVIIESVRNSVNTSWTPVWGEQTRIPDRYNALTLSIQSRYNGQPLSWQIEFRAYNEGVAFRYLLKDGSSLKQIQGEKTEFRLPNDIVVFPIDWTEATFPEQPVPMNQFKNTHPPMTGKFSDGRVFSIMEACAIGYPRFTLQKNEKGVVFAKIPSTAIESKSGPFQSAWRLVMLAENECRLIENEYTIYNLNPAPSGNFDWVQPGLTISNECNCLIKDKDLKSMIDFAAENNMKYVQIDWGWYGTEHEYTDKECDQWAQNNADKAKDPTWRANTKPSPYQVAKGLVPYFPSTKSSTFVDIDIDDLVRYGRSKGVGICLYLNDRMIKKHDIKDLFAVYQRWGLAGLKPGFVAYGSAKNTNELRYLAQTAADHKLWLCIHDAFLPDGMSRTFPNVTCVEGGGGQEGNHPVHHDTVLPFTRGLVGPFDFTPRMYVQGRSAAHQLSLLVTLYNPTPVIRGGWIIRNNKTGEAFGSEKEFFQYFQFSWLETRVLDGEIGKYIVIARKAKSGQWILGATGGTKAVKRSIPLNFLTPGTAYEMTLWTDAPQEENGWRGTIKSVQKVGDSDSIELPLAPGGGAIAVFKPVSSPHAKR